MIKKREPICGIYVWDVIGGNPDKFGEKYVGQCENDCLRRKIDHLSKLRNNTHSNTILQNYYNMICNSSYMVET